ncbi:MAG: MFS transporter [Planctomycetota bacterium]|nr:MFS transporter [Planctomycetota bacterium]MDA1140210.1 MFS transporter [Planctomycetota bacterium]
MDKVKYSRLSLMMFLEYAVWGAWLPVAGRYLGGGLGFTGLQIGTILGFAGAVGAICAPFIAGQVADRYFNTERALAFLFIVGGVVKWYTATQTSFEAWFWLSIIYSILYMPTIALTNSLAFAHMDNQEKEFPYVRVWGTIGWIAASWVFPWIWIQTDLTFKSLPPFLGGPEREGAVMLLANALKFSGILSIGLGFYSLTLPATPPKKDGVAKLAFAKAFALFRYSSFTALVAASLLISIVHTIYFIHTGSFLSDIGLKDGHIGPAMSIGQFAEIIVLAPLGFLLARLKMKKVIFAGCMAYVARYALFGTTSLPLELIVASQFLHGICFSCYYAAAFIYIDAIAEKDIRNSVQTVFGIILLGIGPILAGTVYGKALGASSTNYTLAEAQETLLNEAEAGKTRVRVLYAQQKKLFQQLKGLVDKDEKAKEALSSPLAAMEAAATGFWDEKPQDAIANQKVALTALKEIEPAFKGNDEWNNSNVFSRVDYGKFWYTMAAIGLAAGFLILVAFKDQSKEAAESQAQAAGESSSEDA